MKLINPIIVLWPLFLPLVATSQSAKEIIEKSIAAYGGKQRLSNTKSICIESFERNLSDTFSMTTNIVVDKLYRTDITKGNLSGFSLISKNKLSGNFEYWTNLPVDSGKLRLFAVFNRKQKDNNFCQIQIGLFPIVKKKYSAVFLGIDTIRHNKCFMVKVTTPKEYEAIYWIGTETYYILQKQLIRQYEKLSNQWLPENYILPVKYQFDDFRVVEGMVFPFEMFLVWNVSKGGLSKTEVSKIQSIKINPKPISEINDLRNIPRNIN